MSISKRRKRWLKLARYNQRTDGANVATGKAYNRYARAMEISPTRVSPTPPRVWVP